MKPRVLCVDDEPNVLHGLRLSLRKTCEVSTAESGEAALEVLARSNTEHSDTEHSDIEQSDTDEGARAAFDVIVSDMRMPGMDGAELLSRVRSEHPEVVRILLTGQADLDAAIAAINEAKVFRFLTKPCSPELLIETVGEAYDLRQLRQVERRMLDETVRGSVAMMTDVLGLVNAGAHARAMRIARLVEELCESLDLEYDWELEVAALVSQVGYAVVPDSGVDADVGMDRQASIAAALLRRIPRLEGAAEIVEGQHAPTVHEALKAELLRVAVRFDGMMADGLRRTEALDKLAACDERPSREMLAALRTFQPDERRLVEATVDVCDLIVGMELTSDIMTSAGSKLAASGTVLTTPLLRRIEAFATSSGVQEPIAVLAPAKAVIALAKT